MLKILAASLLSRSALHRLQQQPPLTAAVVVGRKLARHAAVEALHVRLLLLVRPVLEMELATPQRSISKTPYLTVLIDFPSLACRDVA